MKTVQIQKLLLSCFFRMYEIFVVFDHHLLQIEDLSLFQESGIISVRFLVFLPTYLHVFTQK